MALAEFYLETGQYDLARKHALLAGESGAADTHESLARIAVAAGDWGAAESEAAAALKESPNRRSPRLITARVKKDARRPGRSSRRTGGRPEHLGKRETASSLQFELPARRCPGAPGALGGGGGRVPRGDPGLSLVPARLDGTGHALREPGEGGPGSGDSRCAREGQDPRGALCRRPHLRDPGRPRQRGATSRRGPSGFPGSAGTLHEPPG